MGLRQQIKALIGPAARFWLRLTLARQRRHATALAFWKWRVSRLSSSEPGKHAELSWLGRPGELEHVQSYFGLPNAAVGALATIASGVTVTECWVPGALKVPLFVEASVETGPVLDQVRAAFGGTVKKILRRSDGKFSFRHVLDEAEILDLEQRMIRPFAARHGADTSQFDSAELMRYAQGHIQGRFVAMEHQGGVIGCGFGFASYPCGVKTWNACRFGCPPEVFNNSKLLEEVNTQNVHLTTDWARAEGYQSVNLGVSFGRPDSGLIQWKCRRGGYPDPSAMSLFVYLQVPPAMRASFFWDRPVFAAEAGGLVVVAGVPPGTGLADMQQRFKPMAYRRLKAFRIFAGAHVEPAQREAVAHMLGEAGMDAPLVWVDT